MRWSLFKEKLRGRTQWVIRRWHAGRNERLPLSKYRRIREDPAALEELVKRLNAPITCKEKVEFKHAFISPTLLDEYMRYLTAQIPSISGARQEFSALRRHFLNYFIGKLDLMNPLDWHRVHETQWAEYLLSKAAPRAAKTKRDIVIAANRFMSWLHKQRPEEVPPLEFKPLSKAKYRDIEANRELKKEVKERRMITPHDWKVIEIRLKKSDIRPFVYLSYYYGLRRAETLGVQPGDTKQGYLSIVRQLSAIDLHKPLKGKEARRVPHWFASPQISYQLVEEACAAQMNPSTLTHKWATLMDKLNLNYDFHDLRHTFITRAIRLHPARDVQLAAGHKDIRTTMGYAHDDRTMDDEEYRPA